MNEKTCLRRTAVSLVTITGLFLVAAFLGGCCSTTCCVSEKCTDLAACSSSNLRAVTLVKNRIDNCPDTWTTGLAVMAGDKVRFVNCSGLAAKMKFTPSTFFVGAAEINLPAGASTTLTVRSDVVIDQSVSWLISSDGPCSHGGSQVIVRPGP
jgi:hypothetical protein